MKRTIKDIAYDKYKFFWIGNHYSYDKFMEIASNWCTENMDNPGDFDDFDTYLFAYGLNGWKCFPDFICDEYKDEMLMKKLLTDKEFLKYKKDIAKKATGREPCHSV